MVVRRGCSLADPTWCTLIAVSDSADARSNGRQAVDRAAHAQARAPRGPSRAKVEAIKVHDGPEDSATRVERGGGTGEGGVGKPSPPTNLRWLAEGRLDKAALPTVSPTAQRASLMLAKGYTTCAQPASSRACGVHDRQTALQVMRKVFNLYKNPEGGKGVKRPRPQAEASDSRQTTLSHFFARSGGRGR